MNLSDEIERLHALHRSGALSDEEFAAAKARLLHPPPRPGDAPVLAAVSAMRRSTGDRWIAGVCGGLGRATGVESWVWRLAFALLLVWGGAGLVAYLLLWIFVPPE